MSKKLYIPFALLITLLMSSFSFAQEGGLTRLEFAKKVLGMSKYELSSESASMFGDIQNSLDIPYSNAASSYGLIKGYDNNFFPNSKLTKEQAIVIIVRAMGEEPFAQQLSQDKMSSLLKFSDSSAISSWAKPAVAYLVENGLLEASGSLGPQEIAAASFADDLYSKCKSFFDSKLSREGYSAALILDKASKNIEKYDTYKFKGDMDMDSTVTAPDENNNPVTENTKMKMVQEGVFEKPENIYVKSTMTIIPMNEKQKEELGDMLEQTSELYYDGQKYLMKTSMDDSWFELDITPLIKQLQSMTGSSSMNNQGITREQLELYGMFAKYGLDEKIDGKDCYTINVELDSATFNKLMKQIMDQTIEFYKDSNLQQLDQEQSDMSEQEMEEFKATLNAMFSNMNVNVGYKFIVDKETLEYRSFDIKQKIDMSMGDIKTTTNAVGSFEYYDFNKPVEFPQIKESDIKSIDQMNQIESPE
ncbi:S-layer homology domain-containing protein [Peptoclostridium acidaminophilum]|uniref:S-layer homology domain-containing protein n=1 Tax=Peptoclostridium acidaminophilum TaxID=1731 RepID=UPI00046D24D7|nr:S-layer homology domain-containing protein [Peptoclostridium acidaminophilum]